MVSAGIRSFRTEELQLEKQKDNWEGNKALLSRVKHPSNETSLPFIFSIKGSLLSLSEILPEDQAEGCPSKIRGERRELPMGSESQPTCLDQRSGRKIDSIPHLEIGSGKTT